VLVDFRTLPLVWCYCFRAAFFTVRPISLPHALPCSHHSGHLGGIRGDIFVCIGSKDLVTMTLINLLLRCLLRLRLRRRT
jgi:hypothetical protein